MRGDTEENTEKIRVDSPTAHKDSIKLALSIAANEDFDKISADVKAVFLQGRQLDRNVFVKQIMKACCGYFKKEPMV